MDASRIHRVLKQHIRTDQLLGVRMLPAGKVYVGDDVPSQLIEQTNRHDEGALMSDSGSLPGVNGLSPSVKPLDRDRKQQILSRIDCDEVRLCLKCELCHGRTKTVFGEGDPDAPVMFIGEGPGQSEDQQGRPFVGRAGELLTRQIEAMGFNREQVYIGNVVKCRPPNNRTPTPLEVDTCWDYLRRQIQTISPKVIVTLGGPATKMILQTKEGITRLRGSWYQYDGVFPAIPVMPTFHPAYLLRSYTVDNRKKVWADLQAVMKKITE